MPQIVLPNIIDAGFLAKSAGLGNAWGAAPNPEDPTTQIFAFETLKFNDVEAAISSFPVDFLAHKKRNVLEDIATKRVTEELKGPMGLKLDDKTVARLTAAATGLMLDPTILSIQWELTRGNFVTLSRETILALAVSSVRHVQACFNHVATLSASVSDVTIDEDNPDQLEDLVVKIDTLNNIDIMSGWPSAA